MGDNAGNNRNAGIDGAAYFCIGILFEKKRTWFLLVHFLSYMVGFYINVTAPGNDKRSAYYQGIGDCYDIS